MRIAHAAALALGLAASNSVGAQPLTCRDVIESEDPSSMDQVVRTISGAAFKASAYRHASDLHKGLQGKGVANALQIALDRYETAFIPVREGAGAALNHVLAQNGGLAAGIAKICPEQDESLVNLFSGFYDALLNRYDEIQQGSASS